MVYSSYLLFRWSRRSIMFSLICRKLGQVSSESVANMFSTAHVVLLIRRWSSTTSAKTAMSRGCLPAVKNLDMLVPFGRIITFLEGFRCSGLVKCSICEIIKAWSFIQLLAGKIVRSAITIWYTFWGVSRYPDRKGRWSHAATIRWKAFCIAS